MQQSVTWKLDINKWYSFNVCNDLFLSYMFDKYYNSMSIKDFQVLTKLGEGAYSTVFKARRLADHELYAIKMVKVSTLTEREQNNALN